MSTDSAHSLQDSLDIKVGSEPTGVAKNLFGQEIDVIKEIHKSWGPIHQFLQRFLRTRGFDEVVADELAILPGMEEIFSLLQIKSHYDSGRFDVIIIDCAPTSDTARLLSLPDIARWYMEKTFNIGRSLMKAARPVAKRLVDLPIPEDDVFASVEKLYVKIKDIKELLLDPDITSLRLIFNPEKIVIKESQRTYAFLNLFGFSIDAVIANRILPDEVTDPYYGLWKEIQKEHMVLAEESFFPTPMFRSRLWQREVTGMELLDNVAQDVYGGEDPSRIFYRGKPIEINKKDGHFEMVFHLPNVSREDMDITVYGDEMIIKFRNFKRNVILPKALALSEILSAEMKEGKLHILFRRKKDGKGQ